MLTQAARSYVLLLIDSPSLSLACMQTSNVYKFKNSVYLHMGRDQEQGCVPHEYDFNAVHD